MLLKFSNILYRRLVHDELTIIRCSPLSSNLIEEMSSELNENLKEIHLKFELKPNENKCDRRINNTNVKTAKITVKKREGCKNDIL